MSEFYDDGQVRLLLGDVRDMLRTLPDESIHCCVSSPPYFWLRDYGVDGQIGLEPTVQDYVAAMVEVYREVRRVLRADGTAWLNLGDSFASRWNPHGGLLKPKDLRMVPARVALALQEDGWWLRSVIIWSKPACLPESVQDRPTTSHEYIYLLAKSERYFYDADAVRQPYEASLNRYNSPMQDPGRYNGARQPGRKWIPVKVRIAPNPLGRNLRTVWTIGPEPSNVPHYATFPSEIPRRCILAGTSDRGVCPACGAPWRRVVARKAERFNDREGQQQRRRNVRKSGGTERVTLGLTHLVDRQELGWQPTCACDAGEPVPATVLDPFVGSGTTVAVAKALGRRGVGIDLNPEYLRYAADRLRQLALMPLDGAA